jgi:tetratricopeptide (TPR) repeat protein
MRIVPPEGPDDLSEGPWANPHVGMLIEQAEDRQLSGDHAGALELLDQAVAVEGVDAAYAMAERAASLFELGRQVDAQSQLNDLRKHKPFSAIAFHRAAEAAKMGGDERLALRWFDMALSRCTDQLAQGEQGQADLGPTIALLVFGRRRVRTSLGLPPDELDRVGSPEPRPRVAYPGGVPPGIVTPETVVRVLFWPRDQIGPAAARWPALVQTARRRRVRAAA